MKPSPELKEACTKIYPFINSELIPAGYLYVTLITQSPYYTYNDGLGKLFQALLYRHLENESFRHIDMGRFTHILLALQREVWIPCDLFYDMRNFNSGHDMVDCSRLYKRAVLERFFPARNPGGMIERWLVEFSTRDFKRVSRTGTLEDISLAFSFML